MAYFLARLRVVLFCLLLSHRNVKYKSVYVCCELLCCLWPHNGEADPLQANFV